MEKASIQKIRDIELKVISAACDLYALRNSKPGGLRDLALSLLSQATEDYLKLGKP